MPDKDRVSWKVVVRKSNGYLVREIPGKSKYAAKKSAKNLSDNVYDSTHIVTAEPE